MKKRVIAVIMIIVLVLGLQFSTLATDVSNLQNQRDEVKNQIDAANDELDGVKTEMSEVMKQVQELTQKINEYEAEIAELDTQINELNTSIEETQKQLEVAQEELEEQQHLLQSRVVALYEAGEVTFLDILVNSKGLVDFISNYYLISEIVEHDTQLANQIEDKVNEIDLAKAKLENEKTEVKTIKANKEKTAVALQNSKVVKDEYVKQLSEEEKALQAKIDEYESQVSSLEAQIRQASNIGNSGEYSGGSMAWPTPGYTYITSPFGYRIHPVYGYNKFHSGVDIGAPYGARIVAAADGVVTLAQWNGGYGNCVMINHGGGISTLYAHGSSIKVSVGQTVTKGETVMIVGSTGVSTGAHLHFEVRVNGNYVNPLGYI